MSTPAQTAANQANAQSSTGPKTEAGKAVSARNNFRHGLMGEFKFLREEDPYLFVRLYDDLVAEHKPQGVTETLLVDRMAQHYWLSQRALSHQQYILASEEFNAPHLALFLRYQTTHDRAFHKCMSELLKLRAEKRKQEIGFELQKRKEAEETRKQEMHQARLKALNAKTSDQEFNNEVRQTVEIPMPGHVRVPFEDVKDIFTSSVREAAREAEAKKAA